MSGFVVLRAIGLGDLLCAVPALRTLRAADRTELWTSPWLVPFARTVDLADEILPVASLDAAPPAPVGQRIAVNLHGSGPESHRFLLRGGAAQLWAHRHEDVPESSDGPEWDPRVHEVERWRRFVARHGLDPSPHGLLLRPPDRHPPTGRVSGRVLLHVGASSGARRWPTTRWVRLASRLREEGVPFAVSAGPGEAHLLAPIARAARLAPDQVVEPTGDLVGFAAVVAAARAVVVGDTGVAHLATAFARPSVVLFGPMSPAQWGPPASPLHVAIWKGHTGDPHGVTTDPGLRSIGVDEVWRSLTAVLGEPPASGSAQEAGGYGRHRAAAQLDAPLVRRSPVGARSGPAPRRRSAAGG